MFFFFSLILLSFSFLIYLLLLLFRFALLLTIYIGIKEQRLYCSQNSTELPKNLQSKPTPPPYEMSYQRESATTHPPTLMRTRCMGIRCELPHEHHHGVMVVCTDHAVRCAGRRLLDHYPSSPRRPQLHHSSWIPCFFPFFFLIFQDISNPHLRRHSQHQQ